MATHSSDQLKCPECQRAFTRVASLRSHLMLHEREDNLFCTECGDEFALQVFYDLGCSYWSYVITLLSYVLSIQCALNFQYQLDSHVMEHQDDWISKNVEKVFECVKCQRQFSRTSALKEHMREHVKVCSLGMKMHLFALNFILYLDHIAQLLNSGEAFLGEEET